MGRMPGALPFFQYMNFGEAALWAAMGVGLLMYGIRNVAVRRMCVVAGVTLILFGASDVVEASTGAWYSHWWLLTWKVGCVVVLVGVLVKYVRYRRSKGNTG
jgi:hypothetical protein